MTFVGRPADGPARWRRKRRLRFGVFFVGLLVGIYGIFFKNVLLVRSVLQATKKSVVSFCRAPSARVVAVVPFSGSYGR